MIYIITDLICPELSLIDTIAFFIKMINNDSIDFLLDKGSDVIEDCFTALSHPIQTNDYSIKMNNQVVHGE